MGRENFKPIKKGKVKYLPKQVSRKIPSVFSIKKKGHMKKEFAKFQKWLEDKGNPTSIFCYESNMVNVNINTRWIDSGSTIYISNFL
jgi:hypothetical protein